MIDQEAKSLVESVWSSKMLENFPVRVFYGIQNEYCDAYLNDHFYFLTDNGGVFGNKTYWIPKKEYKYMSSGVTFPWLSWDLNLFWWGVFVSVISIASTITLCMIIKHRSSWLDALYRKKESMVMCYPG